MNSIATSEVSNSADAGGRHLDANRRVLAVDDDRTALMFLEEELHNLGYEVETACDGAEAVRRLESGELDVGVLVLDKMMPGLDGLGVARRLKSDPELRHIPVVMLTGDDDPEQIRQGVEAGVFHYLVKPLESGLMKTVLNAALRESTTKQGLRDELRTQQCGFELVDSCRCRLRTIQDAFDAASFGARLFPDPERVLPGLAELLVNAVEHGNLAIGYELKSKLLNDGSWLDEIDRRLELPEYRDQVAELVVKRRGDGVCAVITDQGAGFDWRSYLRIDPSRAGDNHGRGVAQANTLSFDKLAYNETGNRVVGFVSSEADLNW